MKGNVWFEIIYGKGKGTSVAVDRIGAGDMDHKRRVSVKKRGTQYVISPMNSPTDVFVNGSMLTADIPLAAGDEIAFPPDAIYRFHCESTVEFDSAPQSTDTKYVSSPKRPTNVTIIALVQLLASLVLGFIAISNSAFLVQLYAFVLGIMSVASFISAIGLWLMKPWARGLTIGIRLLDIALSLTSFPSTLVPMIIDGVIVANLLKKETIQSFQTGLEI